VRLGRPLVQRVVAPSSLSLPVRSGERVGKVEIMLGGSVIATEPLVTSRSVSNPGLGGRLSFYAGRTVHHAWSWFS
jgi:hypothetical protein